MNNFIQTRDIYSGNIRGKQGIEFCVYSEVVGFYLDVNSVLITIYIDSNYLSSYEIETTTNMFKDIEEDKAIWISSPYGVIYETKQIALLAPTAIRIKNLGDNEIKWSIKPLK